MKAARFLNIDLRVRRMKINNKTYDIVIIGGGSAGLSAAKKAYEEGISSILIVERNNELGGILNQCIHNGFGLHKFKKELTGPEYAYEYIKFIKENNIDYFLNTLVLSINSKDKLIVCSSSEEGIINISYKCLIFSAGCNERTSGQIMIPGERPNGVFTAGLAQKLLNIDGYLVGKNVYILGSGDIGLIMARRMTLEGANVIGVSEIMPYSNGLNRNIVQCLNDYNIPLRLHNTVIKIHGKNQLEGITICDVDDSLKPIKGREEFIKCDTLLLSIGLYPFNAMLKNSGAKVNTETKGAWVDQNLETTLDSVFSCGNVLHVHDLVDYVSDEGEIAGENAAKLIKYGRKTLLKTIFTKHNSNLGYLLPNEIKVYKDLNEVSFSFRVKKPISKGEILFKDGENIIKRSVKNDLIPSEMVKIKLNNLDFNNLNELSVEVNEI